MKKKMEQGYTRGRAKKDRYNRERGLLKLEQRTTPGRLTKPSINNTGNNKYLRLDGHASIGIDYEKFNQNAPWDGLRGYLTSAAMDRGEITSNYGELRKIGKAFRDSKHDLKARPIHHRVQQRIEGHITINLFAYKVYKEFERQITGKRATISCEQAIDMAKTI